MALSATRTTTHPSSLCPCSSTIRSSLINKPRNSKSFLFNFKPHFSKVQSLPIKISNCAKSSSPRFPKLELYPEEELQLSPVSSSRLVSFRLRRLVSEFRSLPEPIDRVKRLLDYATVLPRLGESTRAPENRVPGCAAQVWLEVEMDEYGRMRFGADSDSEITKGFCSCLIYLLDGAYPEDVLKVKAEDLADMNVGLPVRSRVNSWHNVLINMRERTRALAGRREEMSHSDPLEAFSTLVIPADSIIAKGNIFQQSSCSIAGSIGS